MRIFSALFLCNTFVTLRILQYGGKIEYLSVLDKEKPVMEIYVYIEAIVGIILGILLVTCTKKAEGVTYGRLDKIGRITNLALILVYAILAPANMFIGMISRPVSGGGILTVLAWIVAIISGSAVLFASLGLGFSVALRKRGKSKLSFALQFAGVIGIILTIGLYCIFCGSLFVPFN